MASSHPEGYVLHTYGAERYVRHAVASVVTLRRHDTSRPVALFCPPEHQALLERYGLDRLFQVIAPLPEAHRSIVGFKHHLHRFMPFERCLFVDVDMIWCRNPDPLWQQLAAFPFTATGLERADFFFGGPKGIGVVLDVLLDRRRRTLRRFGLTYLPRVQAGMIYARDAALTRTVCELASEFLARRSETHFRSRLHEGRSEESCEWSLAMAMSQLNLPVFPWFAGQNSPQLDYIDDLTVHDPDFKQVICRYYTDRFVYSLRGIPSPFLRRLLLRIFTQLPGRGDYMDVTPFALHFGWLHQKQPFHAFAERIWRALTQEPDAASLWDGKQVPEKDGVARVESPSQATQHNQQ
ncbi:hypothetical protein [Rhodothermus profundi]|uniref:Glycosyl transferase family 8 n=1 Tax=Rhodothermus profundi TaxID=633813 RepID=A0A1M6RG69_9BACT|nr:hypothetical protein [Rhodothermus profundi]SHK31459.1 hypothetical protein SAMN04488087_0835 [Rhodothermus profundi]